MYRVNGPIQYGFCAKIHATMVRGRNPGAEMTRETFQDGYQRKSVALTRGRHYLERAEVAEPDPMQRAERGAAPVRWLTVCELPAPLLPLGTSETTTGTSSGGPYCVHWCLSEISNCWGPGWGSPCHMSSLK